jgi:hypothetical protein
MNEEKNNKKKTKSVRNRSLYSFFFFFNEQIHQLYKTLEYIVHHITTEP